MAQWFSSWLLKAERGEAIHYTWCDFTHYLKKKKEEKRKTETTTKEKQETNCTWNLIQKTRCTWQKNSLTSQGFRPDSFCVFKTDRNPNTFLCCALCFSWLKTCCPRSVSFSVCATQPHCSWGALNTTLPWKMSSQGGLGPALRSQ